VSNTDQYAIMEKYRDAMADEQIETRTILDIIHRPYLLFKTQPTLMVRPYLTGNTLRLRYEPNRLMLFIGL
jgi:hypothetical protein